MCGCQHFEVAQIANCRWLGSPNCRLLPARTNKRAGATLQQRCYATYPEGRPGVWRSVRVAVSVVLNFEHKSRGTPRTHSAATVETNPPSKRRDASDDKRKRRWPTMETEDPPRFPRCHCATSSGALLSYYNVHPGQTTKNFRIAVRVR